MTKCENCGARLVVVAHEAPFGLSGSWAALVPAKVYECSGCGEPGGVEYEAVGPMLRAITAAVVAKRARLAPEEIRFLRMRLDATAVEFGRRLGVTGVQVSRWETGAAVMHPSADRLARVLSAQHDGAGFDVHILDEITDKAGAPVRLRLTRNKAGAWKAAA